MLLAEFAHLGFAESDLDEAKGGVEGLSADELVLASQKDLQVGGAELLGVLGVELEEEGV